MKYKEKVLKFVKSLNMPKDRQDIYLDAIQQSDTVSELALIMMLPDVMTLSSRKPRSKLLMLHNKKASFVIVVTELVVPRVFAITGGVGYQKKWFPIPHCILSGDKNEPRKYGIVQSFSSDKSHLSLIYITYDKNTISVQVETHKRKPTLQIGKKIYSDLTVCTAEIDDWFNPPVANTRELFHNISLLHTPVPDRWLRVRWKLYNSDVWNTVKLPVQSPVQAMVTSHDWTIRVLDEESVVSDINGRAMTYPRRLKLISNESEREFNDREFTMESDYCEPVVYLPNGNMDLFSVGTVRSTDMKPIGTCIIEVHNLQSVQEFITTTLQISRFVDHRDDDTRNDWELFAP